MKKICILTSVHPSFDGRIFHKEAKTLKNAGYDVTLIAQHNKREITDGITIIPLPTPQNRLERVTILMGKLFLLVLKEKADVYHFHDPELIPIGLILRLFGKKVIYDVHEDVPEQIFNKDWMGNSITRKIVSLFFNGFEKLSCIFSNKIVAATPDIAKKFPAKKTATLKNLPILELIDEIKPLNINKQKPIIIYTGGLSKIRGIKEIIQAIGFVKDRAELWLLGKWENKEFEKECKTLKGWEYTKYFGYVPYGKHYSFIKIANIGLVNFFPLPNQQRAMPNKPFEYMACSLPMVMSNFPYWQETFGKYALFANPYNPEDIAEKVFYLLDNPDKMKKLGYRGRELIEEKYNWEVEQRKLLDIYKEVLNK